jgi:uncharacterized protein (DUF433 family)
MKLMAGNSLFVIIASMNWRDYVERDPQIMLGKPVLKGTRLTVEFILDVSAKGPTSRIF